MSSDKSWYPGLGLRAIYYPFLTRVWLLGATFKGQKCFKGKNFRTIYYVILENIFCFNLSIHSFSILLIGDIFIIPLKVLDVLFYINYILICTPLIFHWPSLACQFVKLSGLCPNWVSRTIRLQFWRLQLNSTTHQCNIHWMLTITQLWMNLNWVNIRFHLGNQFLQK